MAGVFREVTLTWNGKDYPFTPSMALLRKIEHGDGNGPISFISLLMEANSGRPQYSHMAWLVALVMQHAGADVTEDEIYSEMMASSAEALDLYRGVIASLSPVEKEPKKGTAPEG